MPCTLNEALEFIRWFENQLLPAKAHCALAGSVLHKGESHNDLDVIVYPHNERFEQTADKLVETIKNILPDVIDAHDPDYPQNRRRLVYPATMTTPRIDIFILLDEIRPIKRPLKSSCSTS